MADINNKPKLQLRSGSSFNGEKTPSPGAKLLINHGKPNFTIQRSPKIFNGNGNPWPPTTATTQPKAPAPATIKNSNEFVVKSTTFNGVFKPSNISKASHQSLQQNGQEDNEAAKVVLRRAKVTVEPALKQDEDENVPEFIRRQRRIQERLAKENVLDFENRRSGYFTHVMISPTSPNRQSFVETMSSPAIVPGLEIPPPQAAVATAIQREVDIQETPEEESKHEELVEESKSEAKSEDLVTAEPINLNGHADEEEVNRAIEEVNKAVAGEDDDKTTSEEIKQEETTAVAITSLEHVEESAPKEIIPVVSVSVESAPLEISPVESIPEQSASLLKQENGEASASATHEVTSQNSNHEAKDVASTHVQAEDTTILVAAQKLEAPQQNGHNVAEITTAFITAEKTDAQSNGCIGETAQNGNHSNGHAADNEITISHTNALSNPSLPSPDPSGEKGVNYEPKTVVSFSQEMGSDVNKYPDTVKVTKDVAAAEVQGNEELKELAKLKFEIKSDHQDIEVTPVLKVE